MGYVKEVTKTALGVDEKGRIRWRVKKPEPILVCRCGGKYIKTRKGQVVCVPCILLDAGRESINA